MQATHHPSRGVPRRPILATSALCLVLVTACNNSIRVDVDANIDADGLPTPCSANGAECESNQFCLFVAATCNQPDRLGICMTKPEVCTEIFQPVCGCDGQTYANDCDAQAAGVSLDHVGVCP